MKVVIQNKLKKRYLPIKHIRALVTTAAEALLAAEKVEFPVLVSVLLVENDEIRRINAEYRKKDSVTDVLSFPMLDMEDGSFITEPTEIDMDDGKLFLGDIVISVPRAIEQAENYGHSVERELAFLTVHGVLHLLGYDHNIPEREEKMKKRQEEILESIGLPR
ncbi:rRNA maturation RNase YbeY [Thermoclostridium stercorarium subsp. leptospartum DSM 9219]|jgi:probable rRNA maturation factor|uniref:Endoribonuclease YbeY n=1 Tax=Thermoclostridium stercorarium subsp. leptospartum DSM 9219 TaxID=1346611 RepID=A0A1B1YIG6_THEST|nr:rRNA maturation RNase YbeY [Thermoclostridium stercorarium]ANX00544.1 rRNA maturation RNase YbeY [Thermoclostridium stercorarium subsp. leptospartum DSM 9219]